MLICESNIICNSETENVCPLDVASFDVGSRIWLLQSVCLFWHYFKFWIHFIILEALLQIMPS